MKLRLVVFLVLAGLAGCKKAATPSAPAPVPTPQASVYAFVVPNAACEIRYTIGAQAVTVGGCALFPNNTWIPTPWTYTFTAPVGTYYRLDGWNTSTGPTVTLTKDGYVVATGTQEILGNIP